MQTILSILLKVQNINLVQLYEGLLLVDNLV